MNAHIRAYGSFVLLAHLIKSKVENHRGRSTWGLATSKDLLSKQENENGPRLMEFKDKYPDCFVCKSDIVEGQEFFSLKNNKYCRRHTTCSRKTPGIVKNNPSEDEIRKISRKIKGGPKRRRSHGHGHFGGDGFVTIP